jgi:hypothetical protein
MGVLIKGEKESLKSLFESLLRRVQIGYPEIAILTLEKVLPHLVCGGKKFLQDAIGRGKVFPQTIGFSPHKDIGASVDNALDKRTPAAVR